MIKLCLQNDNAETLATFTKKELTALSKGLAPNAKFGNAKGNFINKKEFFDQVKSSDLKEFLTFLRKNKNKYKKFDLRFLRGEGRVINRLDEAYEILTKKGYHYLAQLALATKKYRTTHDGGLKKFIEEAKDKDFDEYVNIFRVDENPKKSFMPMYKDFGEGLLNLRKKIKSKEKITLTEISEIMKGYERHHQIMVNIMKENPTFQKVMDWALRRKPPLTIGFNEFKKISLFWRKSNMGIIIKEPVKCMI